MDSCTLFEENKRENGWEWEGKDDRTGHDMFPDHLSQQTVAADENRQLPIISDQSPRVTICRDVASESVSAAVPETIAPEHEKHYTRNQQGVYRRIDVYRPQGLYHQLVSIPSNIPVIVMLPDNSLVSCASFG